MENKRVQAEELLKEIEKDENLSKVEQLIKNNDIVFSHNEIKYRVRLLGDIEKDELDGLRRKKYTSMLQAKDENNNYIYLTEKNLIKVLKERGEVDIDEIDDEIKRLKDEEINMSKKLGESISKQEGEIILKEYKNKIKEIQYKIALLKTERELYLEFSFENQLLIYIAKIMTYLSLDILEDGQWKRKFDKYEDFEECKDNELIEKASQNSIILQYLKY